MNTKVKAKLVDAAGFSRTITRIAHEIIERNRGTERLGLVGMQTRGVYIAKRVAAKIREIENIEVPVGILDATLYIATTIEHHCVSPPYSKPTFHSTSMT